MDSEMTAETLAELLDIDLELIEKIERGEMRPDQDLIRKLAQALRCDVDELTGQWQPSVRRPKDPWRAFFELADGLGDREGPTE